MIAEKCGTTSGAASKRYSRMKQVFEAGGDPPADGPSSPAAKIPAKATPKKSKAGSADGEGTPTPKRKRTTAKKSGGEIKQEGEEDNAEQEQNAKKPKVTKKKSAAKSKATEGDQAQEEGTELAPEKPNLVKSEVMDDGEDRSVDVKEWVNDLVGCEDEVDV